MDSTPSPPLLPPPPLLGGQTPKAGGAEGSRRRKILWVVLAAAVAAPPALLAGFLFRGFVTDSFGWDWLEQHKGDVAVAVIVTAGLAWLGLKRGWHNRTGLLRGWSIAAAAVIALVVLALVGLQNQKRRTMDKVALGRLRQVSAAADYLFLESPYRIFAGYDDLVGPTRYMKSLDPVEGADLHALFPIRRDQTDNVNWILTLPDGRKIGNPSKEEPKPDGVDVVKLPDGSRLETTYRSGVPDGPFRAYYPDGALWGEATYVKGRLTGPSWLHTHDGRKFNELADGDAAQTALAASAGTAAATPAELGRQKIAAGNFAGAIADLTRALAINPADPRLYRFRGDAKKALGDLDGATDDYCAAEGFSPGRAKDFALPDYLRNAFLERGRLRQARNDRAAAEEDFRVLAHAAIWRAEDQIRNGDYAGAVGVLTPAIELVPLAELHGLRADARRGLRDLKGAEAEYTRAIELAAQGTMQAEDPANQRILSAQWRYRRGHVRRWLGDLPGAAEDFRAAVLHLSPGTTNLHQCDAAAWLFLVQCEQGRKETAAAELAATDRAGWGDVDKQLARFLLGKLTEAQLDATVAHLRQYDRRFQASLYAGLLRRLAGDEAGAQARFRIALHYGSHDELPREAAQRAMENPKGRRP